MVTLKTLLLKVIQVELFGNTSNYIRGLQYGCWASFTMDFGKQMRLVTLILEILWRSYTLLVRKGSLLDVSLSHYGLIFCSQVKEAV